LKKTRIWLIALLVGLAAAVAAMEEEEEE